MIDRGKNIAFIGLTGCGKTTVSKLVAQALRKPWFDCDAEIERVENMSVSDIFAQKGEAYFREVETRCARALLDRSCAVIALGGGAVIHNAPLIREHAVVIYLRRSADSILSTLDTETRPMLRDNPACLYELESERRTIYEAAADITVDNEYSLNDTVLHVIKALSFKER